MLTTAALIILLAAALPAMWPYIVMPVAHATLAFRPLQPTTFNITWHDAITNDVICERTIREENLLPMLGQ